MAIFLVVSSLGFYNSNAFKNFLKYKFKIWNIYSNLYNFEKIHQKVQYLVKMNFTMLTTSNVTFYFLMVMNFFLLMDLEDMFKTLGVLHCRFITLKMKKSNWKSFPIYKKKSKWRTQNSQSPFSNWFFPRAIFIEMFLKSLN